MTGHFPFHHAPYSLSHTAHSSIFSRSVLATTKCGFLPPGPGSHSAMANTPAGPVAQGPFQMAEPM